MKITFPEFNKIFDTCVPNKINTLVIENQSLFSRFLLDLDHQLNGFDGKTVVSLSNKPLPVNKTVEVITQFIPFDINKKTLVNKIIAALEKTAVDGYNYQKTVELITEIEKYLDELSFGFDCDIEYSKLEISSILKAVGIEIKSSYDTVSEKLIDYFELVREFDRDKLFVTVNLRSYIDDIEAESFIDTVIKHEYNVIMLENFEHAKLLSEERYIIDADLCEIY